MCDDEYHPQSPNVVIESSNVEMYVYNNKDKQSFTATENHL